MTFMKYLSAPRFCLTFTQAKQNLNIAFNENPHPLRPPENDAVVLGLPEKSPVPWKTEKK